MTEESVTQEERRTGINPGPSYFFTIRMQSKLKFEGNEPINIVKSMEYKMQGGEKYEN